MRFDKGVELLSLWDYLHRSDIEADVFGKPTDSGRFLPLVPDAILEQLIYIKQSHRSNVDLWLTVARDIVISIGTEASAEVSRIYEYQIVLLGEETSNAIAAGHAAECVLNYVQEKGFPLDRNTAVQGVVYGKAEYHAATPTLFSIVLGENELKWELHDLFQKPGLRKDAALNREDALRESAENTRFRFFASKQSDAQLYGYRNQIIDWDMGKSTYKVNKIEEEQFTEEMGDRVLDNFHRLYRPYKRLFGYEVMSQYCNDVLLNRALGMSIRTYLLASHDAEREDIQPVYRPLTKDKKNPLTFHKARLDWSDLARTRFPKTEWDQVSARGVSLIFCDLGTVNFDSDVLEGADISYAKTGASAIPADKALQRLSAVHTKIEVTKMESSVDDDSEPTVLKQVFVTDDKGLLKTIEEGGHTYCCV